MQSKSVHFLKNTGLAVLVFTLIPALPVSAYIGPGAGLTAIGSFLALIAVVLVAIIGFLWFPIKRILKKRRGKADQDAPADDV